ncbi:hypothetical protein ACIA5A_29110 [Micromonospora sp. NPDC051300]|uniref:hypothetical protein n=1 Tax=Micromonospora sp. NPDC051300 TaxID=3364286 RepID=UPI0037ABE4EB
MNHTHPAADADDALAGQEIEALTALARHTRVRGAGTAAEATEPVDFADLAAHALTSVAANVGGVETLLAGRPGSWEADLVRRLIEGTAPEDQILGWRTEPYRIHLNVDDVFADFGISQLYDADLDAAIEAASADDLSDAQADAAQARETAIEALYRQDRDAYAAAYLDVARAWLTGRGCTVDVEMVRTDYDQPGSRAVPKPQSDWTGLDYELDEHARLNTALPQTGALPDWSNGREPVDAIRAAGRTYGERVDQAA